MAHESPAPSSLGSEQTLGRRAHAVSYDAAEDDERAQLTAAHIEVGACASRWGGRSLGRRARERQALQLGRSISCSNFILSLVLTLLLMASISANLYLYTRQAESSNDSADLALNAASAQLEMARHPVQQEQQGLASLQTHPQRRGPVCVSFSVVTAGTEEPALQRWLRDHGYSSARSSPNSDWTFVHSSLAGSDETGLPGSCGIGKPS
eukprot:TRINITY_DN31622_c0_g1_i1.p1 TRINITY_DN31622_c0_g1~~TRINITY_DN31622_c0_g1_i1.p1  ORF type:complete len:209 (-),score=34.61 TRINITY_DN31622_c0_g1_i1:65-691(-)